MPEEEHDLVVEAQNEAKVAAGALLLWVWGWWFCWCTLEREGNSSDSFSSTLGEVNSAIYLFLSVAGFLF